MNVCFATQSQHLSRDTLNPEEVQPDFPKQRNKYRKTETIRVLRTLMVISYPIPRSRQIAPTSFEFVLLSKPRKRFFPHATVAFPAKITPQEIAPDRCLLTRKPSLQKNS
jgi:hypothetical protein